MGFFTAESARRSGKTTVAQALSALMLFAALSALGGLLLAGLAMPVVSVASSAAEATAELFEELPQELQDARLPQASNIYARDGETLLATFYHQNRVVVPLEEISPWMQKAIVAIEDRRFWEHNGVDGEGLMRAAYINLTSPDQPGASTITQQLVKNTLLQHAQNIEDEQLEKEAKEVSLARKIREWRLALAYEEDATREYGARCTAAPEVDCGKERVLEQYLNIAQFGRNIYGVEAASQRYFSKPAAELNALEAATIAGVTQNPSRWDPVRHPENAEFRRNTVLLTMFELDYLTRDEYDAYRAIPLGETLNLTNPRGSCASAVDAPFFCDYVAKVISKHSVFNSEDLDWTGSQLLMRGGLEIVTTLDIDMQRDANKILRDTLRPDDPTGFAMALVGLDTETGEILTMAQNRDFDPAASEPGSTAINYTVDKEYGGSRGFSPGSTFKPVILAEWLNSGRALNQIISGGKRTWPAASWQAHCRGGTVSTGRPWSPQNVLGSSAGQQTVLSATANSINTAYVAMTNQLDLCNIADMAGTLGFKPADGSEIEIVPSISLGSVNASPMGLAQMYQTFANRGVRCEPIAILSITDSEGNVLDVPPQDCRRAITRELADGVTHGLVQVMNTGSGRREPLAGGRESAGKTGTSQKNAHTWFAGYTPQITSVVWLGHPDRDVPQQNIQFKGHPRHRYVYGSTIALPVWKAFMDKAHEGQQKLRLPRASSIMLNGVQVRVPNVVGEEEEDAQNIINDAGFRFEKESMVIFSDEYPPGTVIMQSPPADSTLTVGSTITYVVATNKYPKWWTNWPAGRDPNVPPDDYWGTTWPPPEWWTNPPNGWNPNPDPDPDPGPGPDPEPEPEPEPEPDPDPEPEP